MKKWLCFLLALGFSFTSVYADDDDEWEYEEEEAPKKKASSKKKKSSDGSESRIGLSVGFSGHDGVVSLVYDMGSGLELGLGVGLDRETWDGEGSQDIIVVPGFSYNLGKGLLDYGFGVSVRIVKQEELTPITGFPYFYVSTELVKNVSLNLNAGFDVLKSEDNGKDYMKINFATRGVFTFYFM
jgi:hypothetical protein